MREAGWVILEENVNKFKTTSMEKRKDREPGKSPEQNPDTRTIASFIVN